MGGAHEDGELPYLHTPHDGMTVFACLIIIAGIPLEETRMIIVINIIADAQHIYTYIYIYIWPCLFCFVAGRYKGEGPNPWDTRSK